MPGLVDTRREELWSALGGSDSVHRQPWPAHDANASGDEQVTLAIQIDGKTRDRMEVPAGSTQDVALAQALKRERVRRHLSGLESTKVIFVQDRLINLVTR